MTRLLKSIYFLLGFILGVEAGAVERRLNTKTIIIMSLRVAPPMMIRVVWSNGKLPPLGGDIINESP